MESNDYALAHIKIGDELRRFPELTRAKSTDFDHEYIIIFIHGFTSHGMYMEQLLKGFDDNGFRCIMFNYNSYRGIQEAANTLWQLLLDLDAIGNGNIEKNKISLVCHSMGGLVARAFCNIPKTCNFLKNIVTLGTPHTGTLENSILLRNILRWGEFVTGAMPGFTQKQLKSAMELIGNDSIEPQKKLINTLKSHEKLPREIPVLSVSGGKQWLEVSKNNIVNIVVNHRISKLMKGQDYDGLVSEYSSNLENIDCREFGLLASHFNNYSEYSDINHTNLTQNYGLSLKLMRWIKTGQL